MGTERAPPLLTPGSRVEGCLLPTLTGERSRMPLGLAAEKRVPVGGCRVWVVVPPGGRGPALPLSVVPGAPTAGLRLFHWQSGALSCPLSTAPSAGYSVTL